MGEPVTIEREVKLSLWPGYALLELDGVIAAGTVSDHKEQHLDAYHDTPDLRLLRRGVTLHFRRGEPPGQVWTLKLPPGSPAIGKARREITLALARARCPPSSRISCGGGRWARR